jgi:hypothetical protein
MNSTLKIWLKAKTLLLAIAAVWGFYLLGHPRGWWQILITIIAIPYKPLRGYRYRLWISQDQDVNTTFGGNPDVTVSSKVGYMAEQGSGTAKAVAKVIDLLFFIAVGQRDHCTVSIERDEKHNEFN